MYTQNEKINIILSLYASFKNKKVNDILKLLAADVECGETANPFNPAAGILYGHEGFLEWLQTGKEN